MRGDNVEIVLVADCDLADVVRGHPELAHTVPELHVERHPSHIEVGTHGSARPEGVSTDPYLSVSLPGAMDRVGWEPDELALLERLGPFAHAFTLESTSALLTCELICTLAPHCHLAISNDFGGIMAAEAFCALDRSAQVEFIQTKYSGEAVARRRAIARGEQTP